MARSHIRRSAAVALSAVFLASPATALNLPFGLGRDRATVENGPDSRTEQPLRSERPVLLSQTADGVRVGQMEEEVRRLTGKVEEMSFLVLQLQEQLRKNQEDNELRFQDLEGGKNGATSAATPERRTDAGAVPDAPAAGQTAGAAPAAGGPAVPPAQSASVAPDGDEIGALLNDGPPQSASVPSASPAVNSDTVASISPNGPVEMYSLAYNYLLAGDYALAEQTFRQYAQAYPTSQDAPDAQYWLGESLYAQSKYRDAAEVFLNAQKSHPDNPKAPEMMLKLGMSLARLDNKETACVTYAEVARRYPQMSANVKRKLQTEEGSANCG